MRSITYGDVSIEQVVKIVYDLVAASPHSEFKLIIGTDSQNRHETTVVPVIVLLQEGKGGKFFYDKIKVNKIKSLREKLHFETQTSLDYADKLIEEFDKLYDKYGFDYTTLNMSIHVDAGKRGPTNELIAEISGWVRSLGYECSFKPYSFAASTVADMLSK